jgi:hypothetical protein
MLAEGPCRWEDVLLARRRESSACGGPSSGVVPNALEDGPRGCLIGMDAILVNSYQILKVMLSSAEISQEEDVQRSHA